MQSDFFGGMRRFLVAALLSVTAMAVVAGPWGPHGPEDGPGDFLSGLDLDKGQRDRIFAIHHEAAPAFREAFERERAAHEALAALARNGRFDETRAMALASEIGKAAGEAALLRARNESRVFEVLTPAQQVRLKTRADEGRACAGPHL